MLADQQARALDVTRRKAKRRARDRERMERLRAKDWYDFRRLLKREDQSSGNVLSGHMPLRPLD